MAGDSVDCDSPGVSKLMERLDHLEGELLKNQEELVSLKKWKFETGKQFEEIKKLNVSLQKEKKEILEVNASLKKGHEAIKAEILQELKDSLHKEQTEIKDKVKEIKRNLNQQQAQAKSLLTCFGQVHLSLDQREEMQNKVDKLRTDLDSVMISSTNSTPIIASTTNTTPTSTSLSPTQNSTNTTTATTTTAAATATTPSTSSTSSPMNVSSSASSSSLLLSSKRVPFAEADEAPLASTSSVQVLEYLSEKEEQLTSCNLMKDCHKLRTFEALYSKRSTNLEKDTYTLDHHSVLVGSKFFGKFDSEKQILTTRGDRDWWYRLTLDVAQLGDGTIEWFVCSNTKPLGEGDPNSSMHVAVKDRGDGYSSKLAVTSTKYPQQSSVFVDWKCEKGTKLWVGLECKTGNPGIKWSRFSGLGYFA